MAWQKSQGLWALLCKDGIQETNGESKTFRERISGRVKRAEFNDQPREKVDDGREEFFYPFLTFIHVLLILNRMYSFVSENPQSEQKMVPNPIAESPTIRTCLSSSL